jgi:opacity protein-like surface antigen
VRHSGYTLGACSLAMGMLTLALFSRSVQAEVVGELYGGGAFTNSTDATDTSSLGGTLTFQNINKESSGTVGGRMGYWFNEVGSVGAFGVGLDVFHFNADIAQQTVPVTFAGFSGTGTIAPIDISTVGIGFDLLRFRLHLNKNDEFQNGRVQPYFSVGPAVFLTKISDTANATPANQSENDTTLGVKVGAGLNFHVTKALSLFGEYRFTHFNTEGTFQDTTPPPSQETVSTDVNTHHFVGGIAYHF